MLGRFWAGFGTVLGRTLPGAASPPPKIDHFNNHTQCPKFPKSKVDMLHAQCPKSQSNAECAANISSSRSMSEGPTTSEIQLDVLQIRAADVLID
jgi:hypothetical protein